MRFVVHLRALSLFEMVMIQPVHILLHSNDIWKVDGGVLISQPRIDSFPYEFRDLRTHTSLYVQLGYWNSRPPRLPYRQPFKLASIQLVQATLLAFERKSIVVYLRTKLFMISDLDQMFDL